MSAALFLLSGCHDLSGRAWIDSPEAAQASNVLGYAFFTFIGWLIIRTHRADRR